MKPPLPQEKKHSWQVVVVGCFAAAAAAAVAEPVSPPCCRRYRCCCYCCYFCFHCHCGCWFPHSTIQAKPLAYVEVVFFADLPPRHSPPDSRRPRRRFHRRRRRRRRYRLPLPSPSLHKSYFLECLLRLLSHPLPPWSCRDLHHHPSRQRCRHRLRRNPRTAAVGRGACSRFCFCSRKRREMGVRVVATRPPEVRRRRR